MAEPGNSNHYKFHVRYADTRLSYYRLLSYSIRLHCKNNRTLIYIYCLYYFIQALFSNPTMLLCSLLGLQLLLVGGQLFVLLRTTDWYQVLSITLLLMINYYTLFKITRDYLICWKVYHAEQIIQERSQMCSNSTIQ